MFHSSSKLFQLSTTRVSVVQKVDGIKIKLYGTNYDCRNPFGKYVKA